MFQFIAASLRSLISDSLLSRLRRVGGEIFWIGLGQAGSVIGGMVGVRLLTQVLRPEQYGELALGFTVVGLVSQVSWAPLGQGVLRFWGPALESGDLDGYLRAVWNLSVLATRVIGGFGALAIVGLWLAGYFEWAMLFAAVLVVAMLTGYNGILDSMQNAARQRSIVAWHQALGQWLRPLLAVGLIAQFGASSLNAVLGYVLAGVMVLVSQGVVFWRKILSSVSIQSLGGFHITGEWDHRIRAYTWPFLTWGLLAWAQQSSDRWALQTFSTTSDVGYYAVLYQIGYMPIILLTGVVVRVIQPILFSWTGDGSDPARVNRARQLNYSLVIMFAVLTLLGTGLAWLLHSQIFGLLVAPEYGYISALMPWLVLAGGIFATGEILAISLFGRFDTRFLILPKIAIAVFGVLLNVIGVYWLKLYGVVLASVAFSLVNLLLNLYLANRYQKFRPDSQADDVGSRSESERGTLNSSKYKAVE